MNLYLSVITTLVIAISSIGCKEDIESKYEAAGYFLIFREILEPPEKRTISINSQVKLEVWTDVEFDEQAFALVPEGGYTGSKLTCMNSYKSVSGSGVATNFEPTDGVILLELQNESDVPLVTTVYLKGESIGIWKMYNKQN